MRKIFLVGLSLLGGCATEVVSPLVAGGWYERAGVTGPGSVRLVSDHPRGQCVVDIASPGNYRLSVWEKGRERLRVEIRNGKPEDSDAANAFADECGIPPAKVLRTS